MAKTFFFPKSTSPNQDEMSQSADSHSSLNIDLAAPPGWSYAAGDTIIGSVVRHTPVVSAEATVTLLLTGRTKTKVSKPNTNGSRSNYHDEYWLLTSAPNVIYQGPLHLPEGSDDTLSWPFEVTIPLEPVASVRNCHSQVASFLPLSTDHPAHHFMPGSFDGVYEGLGSESEGKVEYWLQATLRYKFGGLKSFEATFPITIRHPTFDTVKRYEMNTIRASDKIQTQRLLPGMEEVGLSLKQKTLKLLGSSRVPELHYRLELNVPWVMQLDDPQFLPLGLNIVSVNDKSSRELSDISYNIRINWVRWRVKCITGLIAPTDLWSHTVHSDEQVLKLDMNLEEAFTELESPLMISTGKGQEPVQLGNIFQLRLRPNGLMSGERYLAQTSGLYPDFTTYNIKHRHLQEWRVSFTVAGETREHGLSAPLSIIGSPPIEA